MMKNNKVSRLTYTLLALALFTPIISSAAVPLSGVKSLLLSIKDIINTAVIPLMFALALIFFFWGMGQFILHANEEKTRTEGKQKMIWGVIALFVMLSIYGIIEWIGNTIDIHQGPLPCSALPSQPGC